MESERDNVHTLQGGSSFCVRSSYGLEPGAASRMSWESRIHKELAPTLRENMGDNQSSVIVLNDQGGSQISVSRDITSTLLAEDRGHPPCVIALEHHPNDSRLKIAEDNVCQTLNKRMGTGGGNVPLVMVTDDEDIRREKIL